MRAALFKKVFLCLVIFPSSLWCNDPDPRSERRGVCANVLSSHHVQELSKGVSWVYNWGATPQHLSLNGEMEFIPMVWGQYQGQLDELEAYLDGGAAPSKILVVNEPNLRGQAFISPQATSDWMKQISDTLSAHDIPLLGPQMALGSSTEDSIVAYDPIEEQTVTYTSMDAFLNAFDYYYGDAPLNGIGVHPYGTLGELIWSVDYAYERYEKPVWVTEFAHWNAQTEDDLYEYMVQALDYLERSPKVGGYAWFMADIGSMLALVESRGGGLTRLGELYVNYPAYDPDHYYPVPGHIEAESYSSHTNMMIVAADSDEGLAALSRRSSRVESWIEYQIDVAESGTYQLRMRISDSSLPDLDPAETAMDVTDPPHGTERDLCFETQLQAGKQTFKILVKGLSAKIDWLAFAPVAH
ncbi:MAG: glycosyl hydrolase [Puniceicoccaceae bacterium]